jgi:hypothetical protein
MRKAGWIEPLLPHQWKSGTLGVDGVREVAVSASSRFGCSRWPTIYGQAPASAVQPFRSTGEWPLGD